MEQDYDYQILCCYTLKGLQLQGQYALMMILF